MKKVLLIMVMFLGVMSLAQAQRGGAQRPSEANSRPQGVRGGNQVEQLKELLTLTDDQVVKIEEIMQSSMGGRGIQGGPLGTQGEISQEDMAQMREQMQTRMAEQQTQIKAVLTAEQIIKYDAYLEERSQQMQNRQGFPGGGTPPSGN